MNDLIYRQDAIDAIDVKNVNKGIISALQNIIEELPSAQPDNDMVHLQKEQAYLRGWEEGREALKQSAVDIVLEYEKRLYEPAGTPEDNEMYSYGRGLLTSIERNLKQLPSAEPKIGGWKLHKSGALFICSACKETSLRTERYCPNCGAKMEVDE